MKESTFYQKFANTPIPSRFNVVNDKNLLQIYESLEYLESRKRELLTQAEEIFKEIK
jgi:uncharacterized protein (UPF0335 family)